MAVYYVMCSTPILRNFFFLATKFHRYYQQYEGAKKKKKYEITFVWRIFFNLFSQQLHCSKKKKVYFSVHYIRMCPLYFVQFP